MKPHDTDTLGENELVNLTPHSVTIVGASGSITLPPAREAPRCEMVRTEVGSLSVDGVVVPVLTSAVAAPPELPPPVPGRILIVSRLVADALPDRPDLLFPDMIIRGADGGVVGCRALGVVGRVKPTELDRSSERESPRPEDHSAAG